MKYPLTSLLLIVAALILEVVGFSATGSALGVVLLGAGVSLELWWIAAIGHFSIERTAALVRDASVECQAPKQL
jgi:hypothetical protein